MGGRFDESKAVWKVQQLLCYLGCLSKDFSCLFKAKALGPMPSRRQALEQHARKFCNISTLLLFASSKLKQITLNRKGREDALLCQSSLPRLIEIWELSGSVFTKFSWDITQWARDKTRSGSAYGPYKVCVASPFTAQRFEQMDEVLSFVEVSLFEILHDLRPLLGSSFETFSHILMKLGRDVPCRINREKPPLPGNFSTFLGVGIVLPFHNAQYVKDLVTSPPETFSFNDFNCLKYRPRYSSSNLATLAVGGYPMLNHYRDVSGGPWHKLTGLAHHMLSVSMLSRPEIQDTDIWIGQERTSNFKDKPLGSVLLKDIIYLSVEGRRRKKTVVCLYPSYLLFFRQRDVSLILQYEIPRSDILQVTFYSKKCRWAEVFVFWKSFSKEPGTATFALLTFNDEDKAKVWAGFLAPNSMSYEEAASTTSQNFNESSFSDQGLFPEPLGALTEQLKDPAPGAPLLASLDPRSSRDDVAIRQVQRLLSTIKNPDLDFLDYRTISFRDSFEALLICDQGTDTSHAAIDVSFDRAGFNAETATSWLGNFLHLVPSNSENYPRLEDHLGEYLSKCGGRWRVSLESDEPICFIEIPSPTVSSLPLDDPGPDSTNNFRGALDRFINTLRYPKIGAVDQWYRRFFLEDYYLLGRVKLLIYSQESLDTVEGWVREFMAPAKPPSSMSSLTAPLASSNSQTQYEETADSSKAPLEPSEDMQPTQKDDADV